MKGHVSVTIDVNEQQADIVIAMLTAIGFEGFEEERDKIIAYVKGDEFDEEALQHLASAHSFSYTVNLIAETNWNQEWERNFKPVVIEDFAVVRADFHERVKQVEFDIVITPKMSFGTGHHATTYMMMQAMRQIDFKGQKVLDFGTGTGILAILAELMGAGEILAIDNDDWSINNAAENIERNSCRHITLSKQDKLPGDKSWDVVLANINKHVILNNVQNLTNCLEGGKLLLLSGLLTTDEEEVLNAFKYAGFQLISNYSKDKWICLLLKKAATAAAV